MIIVDYSGIAIAPVAIGKVNAADENLLRHLIGVGLNVHWQSAVVSDNVIGFRALQHGAHGGTHYATWFIEQRTVRGFDRYKTWRDTTQNQRKQADSKLICGPKQCQRWLFAAEKCQISISGTQKS